MSSTIQTTIIPRQNTVRLHISCEQKRIDASPRHHKLNIASFRDKSAKWPTATQRAPDRKLAADIPPLLLLYGKPHTG